MAQTLVQQMNISSMRKLSEILHDLEKRMENDIDNNEHTPERYHEYLDVADACCIIDRILKYSE